MSAPGNWKTAFANALGLTFGTTGRAIWSAGLTLGLISGTPSNPPSGSGLLYLNNSGVLRLRQSDGTDTAVGGGGGSGPTLQTDGVENGDQSLLNLVGGTNITLTDDGLGGVTIDAAGGGGGPWTLTGTNLWSTGAGNGSSGNYNFFSGDSAGLSNTNGSNNTAIGYQALTLNETGTRNNAFGAAALASNTTGSYNNALGNLSLAYNVGGSNNTAIGDYALYLNNASYNHAIGSYALNLSESGSYNVAIGRNALTNIVSGNANTAIGDQAGSLLTVGDSGNICIGNTGAPGDTSATRIGTSQTAAYMSGIYGVTPGGSSQQTVVITDDGQLGTADDISCSAITTTGNATIGGTITADGDITSNAGNFITSLDVVAGGELSGNTLLTVGNATIGHDLTVTGNLYANSNIATFGGDITVNNIVAAQAYIANVTSIDDGDSPYPATTADSTILVDPATSSCTVLLPATPPTGRIYVCKMIGTGTMIVDGNGANIDGASTKTYTTQYDSVTIQSDGSNWFIIG